MLDKIREICGDGGVISGDDLKTRAGDWMGLTTCGADAVIRPRTTSELSKVMKIAHDARQPVVPAGGLTGLVHGADASTGEWQISLERMRAIETVDPIGKTMTVEAGCPLEAAQAEAKTHNLLYAVDLGARGSATIGGTISTNAGGNQVVRYGMTRDNVLGLEAVLADGTVLSSMNHLLKNNAAFDLKQLFIGSEGTLGIVTRAVLRLHSLPTTRNTALLAAQNFGEVQAIFALVSQQLGAMLTSFEVMWRNYYDLIGVESGRHNPPLEGGYGYYIIVETSGTHAEHDEAFFTEVMSDVLERELAVDAVLASSGGQRDGIWAIREDIEGVMTAILPAAIFDVSLPISHMENYIGGLESALHAEWGDDVQFVVFGHLGDGNLHLGIAPRPWSEDARHRAEQLVYEPLEKIGGSVSAEHGIGLEKRDWLRMSRTPEEIATMRQLKAALDPENILNPGKVLKP